MKKAMTLTLMIGLSLATLAQKAKEPKQDEMLKKQDQTLEKLDEIIESMSGGDIDMEDPTDKLSYAFGVTFGESFKAQGIEEINYKAMNSAIEAAMNGHQLDMTTQEAQQFLNQYMTQMMQKRADEARKEGAAFLEKNATREEVTATESGLQYEVLVEGSGERPEATSKVTVHYEGRLLNGDIFDSSYKRGEPATFGLNQVIAGWTEGVQLMTPGSKYRFFIPSQLAYGEQGAGQMIGPGETLVFDVELLEVK